MTADLGRLADETQEFIASLGGAATWPLVARAQQAERVRRIGVFVGFELHAREKTEPPVQ